ncbi:2'-5' RNA ligase family protein [Paenisporosarcina cavernae]|uniref:2'-5' RNA ligase family protein n=1 Tax=Paenisporosarcina cavernae TaxID=2320858 RepID=A0A385YUD9_9BACL|nr:2'-5' RNA ligase family protein [Paenisporosarcina cavernae]AYC30479.1 2'-5' RNA ligase family protein [Paenisporosarcina cavernae]
MYAILANFDDTLDKRIRELWSGLEIAGLTDYASQVADREPHVTLASYENVHVENFKRDMDSYFATQQAFPITFQSLGIFAKTDIIYLAPTVTSSLLQFHQSYYDAFSTYNEGPNSLYVPGKWIPHCTMANHVGKDRIPDILSYLVHQAESLQGMITSISLLETEFSDGKCIRATVIHRTNLTC